MTFIEILENKETRLLIEQIEELIGEEEVALVRIRTSLIQELKEKTGYEYNI